MNERKLLYDILVLIIAFVLIYFNYSYWLNLYNINLEEKNKLNSELSLKKEYTEIDNIANFNQGINELVPAGNPKENMLPLLSSIETKSGTKISKLDISDGLSITNINTNPSPNNLNIAPPVENSNENLNSNDTKKLNLLETQIEVKVVGSVGGIYNFLKYLEEDKRIMDVVQFNYKVTNIREQVEATIIFKVYAK